MKLGLVAGIIAGAAVVFIAQENSAPGSTAPTSEHIRTSTNNLGVTLGGMLSDAGHVIIPVASDLVDTARTEFPNVLGPATADGTGAAGGAAQHPADPAAQP